MAMATWGLLVPQKPVQRASERTAIAHDCQCAPLSGRMRGRRPGCPLPVLTCQWQRSVALLLSGVSELGDCASDKPTQPEPEAPTCIQARCGTLESLQRLVHLQGLSERHWHSPA